MISGSGYGTYVQQSWLLDSPAPVRVSTTGSCTLRALPGIDSLTGFRVGWGKLSAELKLGVIQYCVCLPQAVPSSDCRESPSAHDRQLSAYKGLLLPLLHSGVAELATLGREVFYSHNTFAFDLDPSTECRDYQGRHRPPDFYVNAPPLSARSLLRRIEVHMSMTAVDFAKLRRLNAVLFNDCLHPSARVDVYIHFIVSDYHCSKRIPYRCMDDSIEYSVLGLTSKVGLDYCSTMLLNSLELEFEQVLKRLDSDPIRIPLQGSVQVVGQAYTTLNMRPSASAFTPSRNGRPVDARDTAITYPTCLRNRHGQDVLSPESYALWKAKFEALVELTPHVAPASSPSVRSACLYYRRVWCLTLADYSELTFTACERGRHSSQFGHYPRRVCCQPHTYVGRLWAPSSRRLHVHQAYPALYNSCSRQTREQGDLCDPVADWCCPPRPGG